MSKSFPRTLITGVTGQDGSFLAEQLVAKGHMVYGMVRYSASPDHSNIAALKGNRLFETVTGDLSDEPSLRNLVREIRPDYLYNLAAMSHVGMSTKVPWLTCDVNTGGVLRLLEAIRTESPATRMYQASTSEMFGGDHRLAQSETTPFSPKSPYGIAKLAAYWLVRHYREAHGVWASNGILFNHESERRGKQFVTRKITRAAAAISLGLQKEVRLGNLEAHRDWGYAPDFMEAAQLILEHKVPDDFVVGTGVSHKVLRCVEAAFSHVGLRWEDHVIIDPKFYRPAEVHALLANATKAREELGWRPKTTFNQMITKMVKHDLAELSSVG
jgi:GDPmannose 4,6-dehydratase